MTIEDLPRLVALAVVAGVVLGVASVAVVAWILRRFGVTLSASWGIGFLSIGFVLIALATNADAEPVFSVVGILVMLLGGLLVYMRRWAG